MFHIILLLADDAEANDQPSDGEHSDKTGIREESEGSDEESSEESEKFIEGVKEAIANSGTINRKHAHSMFVGPPESGKSSLMHRLLGIGRKHTLYSPSTGVCNPVVIVDISIDNPSTFHPVTVIDATWKEVKYDESLVRQMNIASLNTSSSSQVKEESPLQATAGYQLPPSGDAVPKSASFMSTFTHAETVSVQSRRTTTKLSYRAMGIVISGSESEIRELINASESDISEMLNTVIKKYGGFKEFRKFLTKSYSLYLRDTGGQVEFQEMISLLIFGPSIFFFVFRLDLEFQSKFTIKYRVSESESTNCYTSSITTEEALLQFLASVYAMDTSSGRVGVKTHKPLAFIVGTHKDMLGPSADEKIAYLNKHLDSIIVKGGFKGLVQYANKDVGQVMFVVDNTSEGDEDFKPIRSKVHSLVTGRDEFSIEYPISYLLFCLELQNLKCSILKFDECRDMAAKYGIVGDQVSHLLQFLHLRLGVIQYFDEDGLRHIVVKEPQVLFNKVTNLIIRTFSSDALTTKEQCDFEKGIVTASVFKNVVSSDDKITCQEFLKLLVHLRIITPYPSTTPGNQEERYFIPCVLNHVQESREEDLHTDILPLYVKFECKHCPKGLFGVLVTHLMTPESSNSHTSFTLIEGKIFKDQVSFEVHSYADQDEISCKIFPSHLEVKFFPSQCENEDRDVSVSEVCSNVREIVKMSIIKSLRSLHYNEQNVQPVMCFTCERCSELHRVKEGKRYHRIYCDAARTNPRIPLQGRCWYNEGQ